ncbi:ATP-dependent NAD(P)H-hydrate dehydratase [Giardia muris]|uniref:ATP-dependent (S)-NAD(P)H-hydrate dehydratase n=1 Tax=Giardia muris TaxID=5742 RepID=A0A4Z1SS13_GIAMU|nr:ATP-dependent NAD(P)H-hydrate dehydratase [Giardia muris]|eukprot:TNJ28686.1 ATP-dependent NAD(P)H-hydrate dehydratase [Giardia muris]
MKGDNGRPLLVCGSDKYHGAAIYAGRACIRAGADYCFILAHGNTQVIAMNSPEFIVSDFMGAWRQFHFNAMLVGPGLDVTSKAEEIFITVMNSIQPRMPLVIDADGLTLLLRNLDRYIQVLETCRVVLTPNMREFSRIYRQIFGQETPPCNSDTYLTAVLDVAKKLRCTLIVKGPQDVIASNTESRMVLVREPSQPKRASGQGDVLAGCLLSLLCTSEDVVLACQRACYAVRSAACMAFDRFSMGMATSDMLDFLPTFLFTPNSPGGDAPPMIAEAN